MHCTGCCCCTWAIKPLSHCVCDTCLHVYVVYLSAATGPTQLTTSTRNTWMMLLFCWMPPGTLHALKARHQLWAALPQRCERGPVAAVTGKALTSCDCYREGFHVWLCMQHVL